MMADLVTRIAEIRQDNRGGDVSYRDIEWLCSAVERLHAAMRHVVNDSPGTPDSVKKYLVRESEGSWGDPYERAILDRVDPGWKQRSGGRDRTTLRVPTRSAA